MEADQGFYWKKEIDKKNNLEYVILGWKDASKPLKEMEAWIVPSQGSNLCRLSAGGRNIIDFDAELLLQGDYTGTPVLYPTPNRVRNGIFMYKGKLYNQIKREESVFEHGLVHNEAWEYSEPQVTQSCAVMKTWIDFNEESVLFEAFPFKHRLELCFELSFDGIRVTYSIINQGELEIPYGFGLHPYFMKLSGEEDTTVSLPVDFVMDYTSDLLPTGRLIDTKNTIYDLKKPMAIGSLDMDHVFTGIQAGRFAEIDYKTLGLHVSLEASNDFSHLVLYSPRGKDYFCMENQTCSTDAHNLYSMGFTRESGLKAVPENTVRSGYVKYVIKGR